MKRSQALQPLSHQHHQGLFVAQKLRRATEEDKGDVREQFLDFWDSEARGHFRVEEEVLLPAYARHAAIDRPEVVRVLTEHVLIRRFAGDLGAAPSEVAQLQALGELLEGHIRHEERTLFPLIEEAMTSDEQAVLAATIEAAQAAS